MSKPAPKVKAAPSNEPVTKRLHISGLASSVKAQDIVDRFASFGKVVDGLKGVDGLEMDANGFRKSYAFVTIESTEQQLNKCISLLSGSMWKGHKLKIAVAKPDYKQRLEAERLAAESLASISSSTKSKKRKRVNPDPNVGYQAHHFELVKPENIDRHRGWTLDTSSSSEPIPLFPLILRPTHPIFPPPKPPTTSWTRETPKARIAREARIKSALERPVIRSKRMRIDVRKWGRKKIVYPLTEEAPEGRRNGFGNGSWVCEQLEDGVVEWSFRLSDGRIGRREVVRLGKKEEHTDRFASMLERMNRPIVSVETASRGEDIEKELDQIREENRDDDEEDKASPRIRKRAMSLSPPPYIPAAARSLLYNEEDTFALLSTTRAEDELKEARRVEKEKQMKVLMGLLNDSSSNIETMKEDKAEDSKRLPKVEGFANDDDEDEKEWEKETLRLRGGAKSDDSDSDSSDASSDASDKDDDEENGEEDSSDDDSDSDEEESSVTVTNEEPAKVDKPKVEENKTKLQRGSLKEMFKPKEGEASFSLMDGLDLELEELERTPSPPPTAPINRFAAASSSRAQPFVPPPPMGGSSRAWIGQAPASTATFFPFPYGAFEDPVTGGINEAEVLRVGMTMERAEELKRESDKIFVDPGKEFWRSEEMEETERNHQEFRDKLKGVARKRHREAVKKEGKTGKKARKELWN